MARVIGRILIENPGGHGLGAELEVTMGQVGVVGVARLLPPESGSRPVLMQVVVHVRQSIHRLPGELRIFLVQHQEVVEKPVPSFTALRFR
jgi:hypothetical protein